MDLNGVESTEGFGAIPAGNYIAHIIDSKECVSKNTGNDGISFTWQILEGPYAGRLVFSRHWLGSVSPKAKEISQQFIKSVAVAIGHRNPSFIQDSTELHGRQCDIKVIQRMWNDEMQNEVKSVKAVNSTAQTLQTAPESPPAPLSPPVRRKAVSAPPVEVPQNWSPDDYTQDPEAHDDDDTPF